MPNTILFINKSAKSKNLTRSDGFERSKIFSHVQQLPYRPLEDFRVTGWDVSTAVDFHPNTIIGYPSGDDVDQNGSRVRQKRVAYKKSPDYKQRCVSLIESLDSPHCGLKVSELDPFDCAAVPMDAYMTDLLKVYCNSILEEVFVVKGWAQATLTHHLKYASESPELLYAILCSASGAIYAQNTDSVHGYYSMKFRGKALHHLRRSIDGVKTGQEPNIATVFAIGFHVYLECLQGDVEAARSHYSALEKCMSQIAFTERIPLPIRVNIMIPSFFVAGMLAVCPIRLPIFEGREEDSTDSFLDEIMAKEDFDVTAEKRIGSGFFKVPNQKILGPRLSRVVTDIYEIEQTRTKWTGTENKPTRNEMRNLFTKRKDIEYNLLSTPFDPIPLTSEQNVVRLALYLSCRPTLAKFPLSAGVTQSLAAQIYSSLKQTRLFSGQTSRSEVLLWSLVVATSVCFGSEERSWLVEQATALKNILLIQSKEQMEETLAEFFYPRQHFASILESLWNDMASLTLQRATAR